jgi:hypothetical protein
MRERVRWLQERRWGGSGRWRLVALAAALAVGAVGAPVSAEDNADQNLYVDYVAGSWDDWSWDSGRRWNSAERRRSFAGSAKLAFTKAWGAIRLHYRGFDTRAFDTTGYTHLEFFIHWGDTGPHELLVYALRNEDFNKTTKLSLAKYIEAEPDPFAEEDGWYPVRVPLADLRVANVTDLTDFILSGPSVASPFFIDDMKLVKQPGPTRVTLSVDATRPVRALDGRHLGINTAAWDYQLAEPTTIERVKAAGLRFFRFPGGSSADQYHWEQNRIDRARTGTDTTGFMKLVQAAGGQAIITVNYGTGTPEEAAGWVRFTNVTNDFKVKYWEVGNENYGDWEAGSHDPLVYARRFGEFVTAMKAVDPTIKVGMPGLASRTEHDGWAPKALKALTVRPDFYVVHHYPQVRWSNTPHENDANLLQYPKDWATIAQLARAILNENLGESAKDVEILATENNSVSGQPGKQSVNLVNALYLADSLGQVLNTEITAYLWWNLHNSHEPDNNNSPTLYGHRLFGDYGILSTTSHPTLPSNTPYPTYYALRLFSELGAEGSHLLTGGSNYELLPAYASMRENGDVVLLVINKNSRRSLRATVNVAGFTPSKLRVQQYGAFVDALDAGIVTYELPLATPRFPFLFPSYSITVLTMQK